MIIDCHTHAWEDPKQLGTVELGEIPPAERSAQRLQSAHTRRRAVVQADPGDHLNESEVDRAIVFGYRSKYLSAEVPNSFISQYVMRDPARLIGFASIDPTEDCAVDDVIVAREQLKLRGILVSPSGQDFHPADTRAMAVYEQALKLKMPVVFHGGGLMTELSKLEYARPFLIDEVARAFPDLPIVVAQMGQPWIDECIVLAGKHRHVYADVSGLLIRAWPAYNALVSAYQYGVIDKLLFGSDYPYTKPADCIEALFSINQMVQGTNLPMIPRESLRGIVERDSLTLLGIVD